MSKTKITSIRIDEKVFREAKALGLNISVVAENALREAISALKRSKGSDCPAPHDNPMRVKCVAPGKGFEPLGPNALKDTQVREFLGGRPAQDG